MSGRRKEKERVLSNKSVQTIVVKQLRRVYIRVSLAGPRGGGRTEMTSPDRETDSRWPRLSKASFILGPRSRTPAAWNFFNWIHGVGPQRTVSQSCILLLLSTHSPSLSFCAFENLSSLNANTGTTTRAETDRVARTI